MTENIRCQHLPDCMMPDGAEPCVGYRELRAENERLQAVTDIVERLDAYPGPADLTELIRIMVEQRHEAADLIKRLRVTVNAQAETIARLDKEIARMAYERR